MPNTGSKGQIFRTNYTEEEKRQIWNASLPCFKVKNRVNLHSLSGVYYVPYFHSPGYWASFGKGLCKWINVIPNSANSNHYRGGYFTISEAKVYNYTGSIRYNRKDKVYNTQETFITAGFSSIFNTVPCVVSKDTFMFFAAGLNGNQTCVRQAFVFSRNSKAVSRDLRKLETQCYNKFNLTAQERPTKVTGCTEIGLF